MEDSSFSALSTDRLTIRRFRSGDATALVEYRSDPEVARYQDWLSCSEEEATGFIQSLEGLAPGAPGSWF